MEDLRLDQWRASHENTKYPFTEKATLFNQVVQLPDNLLIDASLYPKNITGVLYLSKIEIQHDKIDFYLGDQKTDQLAVGSFFFEENTDTVVFKNTATNTPAGIFLINLFQVSALKAFGLGLFRFTKEQTEFCPTAVITTLGQGIRAFRLPSGEIVSGDVWFVGDSGVTLKTKENQIEVHIVGDPLFRRRLCTPAELFTTPRFIKRVRVVGSNTEFTVTPDPKGNIEIFVTNEEAEKTVLRLITNKDGLTIKTI